MITRATIEAGVKRINESQRQAVRSAIKSGSKIVSCGRYYENGPLVLTVETPASWRHLEAFFLPTINCTIPKEKEAATLAWIENRK